MYEVWENNFFIAAISLAIISIIVSRILPVREFGRYIRLILRVIFGFITMCILSAIASVVVHSTGYDVIDAISNDFGGAISYFMETGLETTVLWFPLLVVSSLFLFWKEK